MMNGVCTADLYSENNRTHGFYMEIHVFRPVVVNLNAVCLYCLLQRCIFRTYRAF